MRGEWKLWVAQGFGAGRAKWAPGTFGSLLGLLWFALLLSQGDFWVYLGGCLAGIGLSVWLCDEAERILGQTDPGCVVLDEIVALPVCFLGWVTNRFLHDGLVPGWNHFFVEHWAGVIGVFTAFRFFDIIKPWPVRQSQKLRGGWGVTMDDALAAAYVNAVVVVAHLITA